MSIGIFEQRRDMSTSSCRWVRRSWPGTQRWGDTRSDRKTSCDQSGVCWGQPWIQQWECKAWWGKRSHWGSIGGSWYQIGYIYSSTTQIADERLLNARCYGQTKGQYRDQSRVCLVMEERICLLTRGSVQAFLTEDVKYRREAELGVEQLVWGHIWQVRSSQAWGLG